MNQTSPAYTLFEQRTKENSNQNSIIPLFADWLHSTLQIDIPPANYPPDPVILPHPTSTKSGIVVMCIPSLLQPSQFRGISSSIHCWTKSSTESTANPQQEIAKAIIQQYSSCVHNIKIIARVNPSMNDFKASFTNQNMSSDSRILFHYSQYGASGITPQSIVIQSSPDISSSNHCPIENVLNSTATCSLHIIDCDNAGLLLPTYDKFVNTRNNEKLKTDIFAFFSCGALEKLPRSPGLPFDLFTSCITTPARTALLWHSRHYYCFKNGPLRPLPIDFFDQASPQIINEITITLHRLVEAMAFEVFEPELFLKVFHSDSTIAHFAANFYLASRIFSFFNVTPLSYPTLPDLRKNQLWHSFDLRLDVALLQLNSTPSINKSPSLTFSAYLEQSLKTLRHLLGVATKDISFPSQLTQLPLALTSSEDLQKEACEVIALYIDKSINAIRQLLYFPIVFPLFQLLPKRIGGESLLFSLSKILCFMPQTREMLNSLSHNVIEELIFPILNENDKPLFALISATLITRYNQQVISSLNNNWKKTVLPLLKKQHQDVKIWALLFLSSFIEHVDDYKVALVPIFILLNDDSPEVRLVALYTLCCFSGRGLDTNITPSICKLCTDASVAVRLQLLCTITFFEEDKYVEEALQVFSNDPHPDVQSKQKEVVEFLKIKKEESNLNKNLSSPSSSPSVMQNGMKTFIFEWYSSAVLNQISKLLNDPSLFLSEVQPTSVKLTKHESIAVPRAEFKKLQAGPTVLCDSPISTNFSNTNAGEFVFGTRNGEIALLKWGEQKKPLLKQITKSPLSHVQFIANNSFPLILATNSLGYFHAFQFNEKVKEVKPATCFRICNGSCEFECSELDRKIFVVPTIQQIIESSSSSYLSPNVIETGNSSKAMIYDIQKEKMIGNVSSRWGRVRKIHTFSTMRDVIAVCSEKFELYDTRTDTSNSVVTYDKSGVAVFDVGYLDPLLSNSSNNNNNNSGVFAASSSLSLSEYFALGHKNSAASLIDIRVQEAVKTFQLASEDSATLSFAAQGEAGTAAIGNAKGLFMVDLFHERKSEITVVSQKFFSKGKKINNVKQCIFHNHKFRLAVLQEPNEIVTFIEES